MIRAEIKPTIATTLTALRNVGNAAVTFRLHPDLFPATLVKEVASHHRATIIVADSDSAVTTTPDANSWDALRRFAQELLARALDAQ